MTAARQRYGPPSPHGRVGGSARLVPYGAEQTSSRAVAARIEHALSPEGGIIPFCWVCLKGVEKASAEMQGHDTVCVTEVVCHGWVMTIHGPDVAKEAFGDQARAEAEGYRAVACHPAG